jgi:hypothetical protein
MDELEKLELDITEEVAAAIGDLVDGHESSIIKETQPPESVIQAMAVAAAQVLMAFERGYRMSEE